MYHVVVAGILAGVGAHLGIFIRGEWHLKVPHILSAHVALLCAVFCFLYNPSSSLMRACHALLLAMTSYLFSLFGSIALYRVFFHRTSHFPGPKLAAVTQLWHAYKSRNGKNFRYLQELHEKYGSFFRTGPNEITLCYAGAIKDLEITKNQTTKDVWYDVIQPRVSTLFVRDEIAHSEMRKRWTQALSKQCMESYHPRIARLVEELCGSIARSGSAPVNINETMTRFSFDVMGEVLLGKNYGLTNSQSSHPGIVCRDRATSMVSQLGTATWAVNLAVTIFPFYSRIKEWFQFISFCEQQIPNKVQLETKPNMMSFFIEEQSRTPNNTNGGRKDMALSGTVITAVVAGRELIGGSDTVRATLIAVCWYLARYPNHAEKIRSEVLSTDPANSRALYALPHMSGFINEVLRLVPPAMTGLPRLTGPRGMTIDGIFIPPFTRVIAPKYIIMRLESCFADPGNFIPERWYSKPELIRNRRAFGPFGFGNRECVAKDLANMIIRLVLASLVQNYNIEFAPDYDPDTIWRDMEDKLSAKPGKVLCVFKHL